MNNKFLRLLLILVWICGLAAVFGAVTMYLWNALLPPILGLPVINWLQAAGLLVLSRVLFGGISGVFGGSMMGMSGRRVGTNPFRDGWHAMTEEQRKNLAEEIQKRHGFDPRCGFDPRSRCGGLHNSRKQDDTSACENTSEKKDEAD
ncbi:hypothetical protein ACYULU_07870 [Breznakiellaceae bacterium SP9]